MTSVGSYWPPIQNRRSPWYTRYFFGYIRLSCYGMKHLVVFPIQIIESAHSFTAYIIKGGKDPGGVWTISPFVTLLPLDILQTVRIRPRFSLRSFDSIMSEQKGRIA